MAHAYHAWVERAFVEWVCIENYRCVKKVDLHLTPLHALIGPNDSGKSTLLQAIWETPVDTIMWSSDHRWVWGRHGKERAGGARLKASGRDAYPRFDSQSNDVDLEPTFRGRALLRLNAASLRAAGENLARGDRRWFDDERGTGLVRLYDDLLGRERASFERLEQRFRALFPTVAALRTIAASRTTKQLALQLHDGTEVTAEQMSEGMLYWLAFAIIEHVEPQAILLIEEPENGLHPARVEEVMRVLRDVSQRTQVLLATHSPLVVNALEPGEVTIVTRTTEAGTICTPMQKTLHFESRRKVFELGELWLNFSDADGERQLVPAAG